jgi:putative hemolysin
LVAVPQASSLRCLKGSKPNIEWIDKETMTEILMEILIIVTLIILNGLFAMSEMAIVTARKVRLQQMAQNGSKGAEAALDLADTPNRLLSTLQIGITLVGIFAGAIGGATIAQALAETLSQVSAFEPYAAIVSIILVVGSITLLTVVLGELVPKRIALQNTEAIAAAVARPMRTLSILAWPAVRLLSAVTDGILKILGIDAQAKTSLTEEEIRMLVDQGARAGIIEKFERDMVESVFLLGDRTLEAIMTPRPEIVWLDVNASQEMIRETVQNSVHSRFPVCDGTIDKTLGLVRAKDLLANCLAGERLALSDVMQDPLFAPDNAQALQVLERFRETGVHLAMLVDEYGGIEGLVTSFDILEAIVGDIPTMAEIEQPPIVQRKDGSWLVEGLTSIDDFKRLFDVRSLPGEGTYQTVGGFVVFMLGSLPAAGSHFGYGGFRFEVADMDGRRVDKVIVEKGPNPQLQEEENQS